MKIFKSLAALGVFAMGAAFAAPAAAQGTVYVVHGIPAADLGLDGDLPVDVSLNGACTLEGFTFGEIIGPVPLDAGSYDIAISLANADAPCGNAPVIEAPGVAVEDGEN